MEMPGGAKIERGLQQDGGGGPVADPAARGGGCFARCNLVEGEELEDRVLGGSGAAAGDAISNLHAPAAGPQSTSAEARQGEPGGRGERTLKTPRTGESP